MPRHPPIALKTLDRSHCQCPPAQSRRDCRFSLPLARLAKRNSEGIVARTRSCAGSNSMSLAQKDQLLEIGSRARLGKPIICGRLSVSRDKSRTFRLMKFEQIFSLRCQNRTSGRLGARHKPFLRMTYFISTRHLRAIRRIVANRDNPFAVTQVVEPDGIEPTTSCLQSRRSPS